MSVYNIVVGIQCFSILLLLIECIYLFNKWKSRMHSFLVLFCVATLVNNVGYLIEMTSNNSGEALIGTKISYLGKSFILLAMFLFCIELARFKFNKILKGITVLFHAVVVVLVFTCNYHTLYYTNIEYTTEGIFPHNIYGHGPFYYVFMITCIVYMVVILFITMRGLIIEGKSKSRKSIYYFLIGSDIVAVWGLLLFLSGVTKGYDTTTISYMICTFFMYITMFKYKMLDTLEMVKGYAVDNISDGIIAVDENNAIIYFNKPALQIYPELEDKRMYKNVVCELEEMYDKNENLTRGELIYKPIYRELLQEGIIRGNIFILNDITIEYKNTLQIKEEKEAAEEARKQAENANKSKSAFLSVVSHEIRTPMNAVVGMTDLMLRDEEQLTDSQKMYLNSIKKSGAALVKIVNDILDQSKIEAGKMEIIEDVYEIRSLLDDIRMIIENRIGNKPIELIIDIDDEIGQFMIGDSLRIRQILINIMNNAVKFTKEGYIKLKIKVIEENLTTNKQMLKFTVEDTGQGIKKDDLVELGNAFSQANTKKNHHIEGTGLGLSISKNFIQLMGGQLKVASEYGKGTEFYFSIYQGKYVEKTKEDEEGNSTVLTKSNSRYKKHAWEEAVFTALKAKILVVDDTDMNLFITKELLKPIITAVDIVNSGEKAVAKVSENDYDMIFMDYMMPYMDGVDTTRVIREKGYTMPVVAISGDLSVETRNKFVDAGMNDFIEKPVEIGNLKRMLLKWLPEEMIENV